MLDWENEVLARRQKAGRGNLADDSATNAAIEAASIKKLTFKADSLQRVRNRITHLGVLCLLQHLFPHLSLRPQTSLNLSCSMTFF